jgi:hypothetical protein
MYFDMYGPFEIAKNNGHVASSQPMMWKSAQDECARYGYDKKEIENAIGCYVFGLRHGENLVPWYVGMTTAQRGFRGEIFQPHKIAHYDSVIKSRNGTPIMFLIPLLTPEGRFSRGTSNKSLIEWVEKMLFGVALRRNPDCRNQRDTKFLRNVVVRGVFNSRDLGRPGPKVVAARQMFGT